MLGAESRGEKPSGWPIGECGLGRLWAAVMAGLAGLCNGPHLFTLGQRAPTADERLEIRWLAKRHSYFLCACVTLLRRKRHFCWVCIFAFWVYKCIFFASRAPFSPTTTTDISKPWQLTPKLSRWINSTKYKRKNVFSFMEWTFPLMLSVDVQPKCTWVHVINR